jgi:hypothetical protein
MCWYLPTGLYGITTENTKSEQWPPWEPRNMNSCFLTRWFSPFALGLSSECHPQLDLISRPAGVSKVDPSLPTLFYTALRYRALLYNYFARTTRVYRNIRGADHIENSLYFWRMFTEGMCSPSRCLAIGIHVICIPMVVTYFFYFFVRRLILIICSCPYFGVKIKFLVPHEAILWL